jgi:hypothetical protein
MVKARERYRRKIKLPDGSLVSAVIWELPESSKERPHGYKYRLNYCTVNGVTLVRYDNELGKGDHKHLGSKQITYKFRNIDQLLDDFWHDVEEILEKKQYD